jgi:cyclopropane-fatty-acyl-phospholipid synthase
MTLAVASSSKFNQQESSRELSQELGGLSYVYSGRVMHARLTEPTNNFVYPYYYFALDLDCLQERATKTKLFAYNQFSLFSVYDRDYLDRSDSPIKQKLLSYLEKNGINNAQKIILLTCPRVLGYVFNPVSFYYCYDSQGQLLCHVAEVNNTFDERHLYLLQDPTFENGFDIYRRPKDFHVSPFYPVLGDYEFRFSGLKSNLAISIDVSHNQKTIFTSVVKAQQAKWSDAELLRTALSYPLTISLTLPRILWQAFRLKYKKHIPVFRKPFPSSEHTILQRRPRFWEKYARSKVLGLLNKINIGTLVLHEKNSASFEYGPKSAVSQIWDVKHDRAYWLVATRGALGFGEGYTSGYWTTPDLTSLLKFLFKSNLREQAPTWLVKLSQTWEWIKHRSHANRISQTKTNISAHYDLGNEFFKLFLDPTLTYSSAIFKNQNESLEVAQYNKLDRIASQANIKSGDYVLEIGSGWGSMALHLATKYKVKVRTVTLSVNQAEYVRKQVAEAGLSDQIEVVVDDYRNITGTYDAIVSIEMIEAVGKEYLPVYFQACERMLKIGGRFVFQVITMEDNDYELYCARADWIQKYIFPGAHLPSIAELDRVVSGNTKLECADRFAFGKDYARTIRLWDQKLLERSAEILALGFDQDFLRMWHYYFCYCEAGFDLGHIDDYQITLIKNG